MKINSIHFSLSVFLYFLLLQSFRFPLIVVSLHHLHLLHVLFHLHLLYFVVLPHIYMFYLLSSILILLFFFYAFPFLSSFSDFVLLTFLGVFYFCIFSFPYFFSLSSLFLFFFICLFLLVLSNFLLLLLSLFSSTSPNLCRILGHYKLVTHSVTDIPVHAVWDSNSNPLRSEKETMSWPAQLCAKDVRQHTWFHSFWMLLVDRDLETNEWHDPKLWEKV